MLPTLALSSPGPADILALVVLIAVAVISWKFQALTLSGSLGMVGMGVVLAVVGGWEWLVPIAVFFISSTLLGCLQHDDDESAERRDIWQVLSNGVVPTLGCLILLLGEDYRDTAITVYIGAVAATNADTWATEIGMRFGGSTRDIVSGMAVAPGSSGGITGIGTFAALMGGVVIAVSSAVLDLPCIEGKHCLFFMSIAGWIGSMVDSLLGSGAQKRYRCRRCGQATEMPYHCGIHTSVRSGFLTSNQVNCLATCMGAFVAWVWLA